MGFHRYIIFIYDEFNFFDCTHFTVFTFITVQEPILEEHYILQQWGAIKHWHSIITVHCTVDVYKNYKFSLVCIECATNFYLFPRFTAFQNSNSSSAFLLWLIYLKLLYMNPIFWTFIVNYYDAIFIENWKDQHAVSKKFKFQSQH